MKTPQVGDLLGSYRLEEEIGSGGAARLFLARHTHPRYAENLVALKALRASAASDPEFVENFRREAYLLTTLKHANIVDTYEAGIDGDELYIAMEYIHGRDLGQLLDRHRGPLPVPVALHVVTQVLRALEYAHTLQDSSGRPAGVIHRDIKPSNILISYDGEVKLTDFGIAALAAEVAPATNNRVLGTKGYFAPEQLRGEAPDQRADIFALGVVLYEILCARLPFKADRTTKLLRQNLRARVPRPRRVNRTLAPDLETVVLKALERRPQRRHENCAQLRRELAPHTPHPAGMALAVGSLVRRLFPDGYAAPHRRQGSVLSTPVQEVVVCTSQSDTLRGIVDDVRPLDVRLRLYATTAELARDVEDQDPPTMIVVDVDDPAFVASELLSVQIGSARAVPVVVIGGVLDPRTVAIADALAATEIIIRPLAGRVTAAALERTLLRQSIIAQRTPRTPAESPAIPVLLVSTDHELDARLSEDLRTWGYHVDVSPNLPEALRRTEFCSYRGFLHDLSPAMPDVSFVQQVRQLPGMGLVPIVFLSPGTLPDTTHFPPRCATRSRRTSSVVLATLLNQLRAANHLGRTFTRFHITGRVALGYRGQSIDCELVNISRGGVLLRSSHLPSVGNEVELTLWPQGSDAFVVQGHIARLELKPGAVDDRAVLGVSFASPSPDQEEKLIALIRRLASRQAPLPFGDAVQAEV